MRYLIPILTGLVLATSTTAKADSCTDAVKIDLARQGNLVYAAILADAVKAGRLYSREDAASGAKRFVGEFVVRQAVPPLVVAAAGHCSDG